MSRGVASSPLRAVLGEAGITYRQFDYWCRRGYIERELPDAQTLRACRVLVQCQLTPTPERVRALLAGGAVALPHPYYLTSQPA